MTIPLHTLTHELARLLKRLNAAEYNSVAIKTAATMLDSSRSTIERMIVDGKLEAFWWNSEKRILMSSIADYIERNKIRQKKTSTVRVLLPSVEDKDMITKTG